MENCTDLAVESYENGGKTVLDGVKVEENGKITTVTVFNKKGAQALGKAVGKYITYCSDAAIDDSQIFDGRLDELSEILTSLLPQNIKSVLVAGLGNTDITTHSDPRL